MSGEEGTGGDIGRPELPPAVRAFDKTADRFDQRFGDWASVAAQRRAVRRHLLGCFQAGSHLLELGGGTAEDALFLLERGYRVTITDGAPAMVARAAAKVGAAGFDGSAEVEQLVLENLATFADRHVRESRAPFDGVYSNFAAFNCLEDPSTAARPLARLLRPGAACVLVVFGRCSPGEIVVELLRGRPSLAFRRLRGRTAPARLGGESFRVWYPGAGALAGAFAPWFRLARRRGVGVLVPPSAAEPWISSAPRLVAVLEAADRALARPFALLGDHILLELRRTGEPA